MYAVLWPITEQPPIPIILLTSNKPLFPAEEDVQKQRNVFLQLLVRTSENEWVSEWPAEKVIESDD